MKEQQKLVDIYIDFDNTISNTHYDQETGEYIAGEPIEGMIEAVNNCAKQHPVVIFTARPFGEFEKVRRWLDVAKVKYSGITNIKKPAIHYVDDRNMSIEDFRERWNPTPKLDTRSITEVWDDDLPDID